MIDNDKCSSKDQDGLPGNSWRPCLWIDWKLKQSFTTLPSSSFSNIVKRIKSTHSESLRQTIIQSNTFSKQTHTNTITQLLIETNNRTNTHGINTITRTILVGEPYPTTLMSWIQWVYHSPTKTLRI